MTNTTSGAFDLNKVRLSSRVTVRRYEKMENAKDRNGLAGFIQERLSERYVDPLRTAPQKHGFLMMAAACLLIETLESFYRGWPDTNKRIPRGDIEDPCKPAGSNKKNVLAGKVAFCYFFQREPAFALFRPYANRFYKCVRCGILHQGETTGGWRIRREGDFFDVPNLKINANKFLVVVRRAIGVHAVRLRKADWDDEIWKNFRVKMNAIIEHCKR
jgi:hypothetical protein